MNYTRTFVVGLNVNTGKPTWWKPNAGIVRNHKKKITHVRFGWLRMAVQIGFKTTREHL